MLRSKGALTGLIALLLILAAAGFGFFDALRQGEDHLIQRQYKAAIQSLQEALQDADEGKRDRILLLLGRAQLLADQPAAAVKTFQRLVDEESGSELVHAAKFHKAKALAAQGNHREAALVYRDEIARLTGLDRKEEIAATYLNLAEKARSAEKPNHGRAVVFYDLALDLGLSAQKTRAVRLAAAESVAASGNHSDAQRRLQPLVDELEVGQGKLRAMLALGRAKLKLGDPAGARTVLRDLRALDKDAPEAADAAYEIALAYGVPTPQPNALERAVAALEELRSEHPEHSKAKIAQFLIARCQHHVGRTADALTTLRQFVEEQQDLELDEVADARAMIGDLLAGQVELEAAIEAWRTYLAAHPSHGGWERVQRAIVDAEYRLATLAYERGKEGFEEATERLQAFAQQYPLDTRNPQIFYLYGDMLMKQEKFDEAVEAFARCVSKYPGKQASSRAQFMIGDIYESHRFHYEKALEAFRKVTWGSYAGRARARIARLERKAMALLTPRVFQTGEAAHFQITSRNIESVRVRVFQLDLEDYFRATHTAGSVERLDIEVIEPDRTFDSKVADYEKYKETKREIAVGFDQPGAYVVKVDDREFEATTMVIVSDIAMIAKSSRHEFFVFTQNQKENRVESGVRVMLSDGKSVFAEGVTDETGVWRYKGEELKKHDAVTAFCVNRAGSGASSVRLSGLGYNQGLTPKGYLFTERPVYEPGQLVQLKGMVREVASGLYTLPRKDGYRFRVIASDGRLMRDEPVSFTDFGTFASELQLPEEAPLGNWRLRVEHEKDQTLVFERGFQVARYQRPRMTLSADLDRDVVFRGETIEGRLVLRYFFGEPAVGKAVRYRLNMPDGSVLQREGVTNAAGEVPFTFETTDFGEEALAPIIAEALTENARTMIVVPVVTTEFVPTVRTVRDVYLAGETFRSEIELEDRSGKPVARKGEAVLLRVEKRRRGRGAGSLIEVEVARKAFRSDAQGKASVAFVADKGGSYRVRVEAVDRFENLVSAVWGLTVSGDDDSVKLRVLADRDRFKVGEKVRVKVANRAGERLVLQTIQGDGILAHRSFVLPPGESELSVDLEALHAPNFALSLAMIDGRSLYQAGRDFRVERDLDIRIQPVSDAALPGSKLDVNVEVRDPEGNPVAAELALAMIDDAVLAVYPDGTPAMGAFFYGVLRETAFRTVSSCTWSYSGSARPMSDAILAEERRRKELEAASTEEAELSTGSDDFFLGLPAAAADPRADSRGGGGNYRGPGDMIPGGQGERQGLNGLATGGPVRFAEPQRQAQLGRGFVGQEGTTLTLNDAQNRAFGNLELLEAYKQTQQVRGLTQSLDKDGVVAFSAGVAGYFANDRAETSQPRVDFSSIGAWLSSVRTGEDGKAKVAIELPDRTSGWSLVGRGITADTWVGEGRGKLRTVKDLQVALIGPPTLTEGDEVDLTGRIHNLTEGAVDARMSLRWDRGGKLEDPKAAMSSEHTLAARTEAQRDFAIKAEGARPFRFVLEGAGGNNSDRVEWTLPVQPFGIEQRDGHSGRTSEEARFGLGLPEGRSYAGLRLWVEIGPDSGRDLMAAVLGFGARPDNCWLVDRTNLARAARGAMALELLRALEGSSGVTPVEKQQLLAVAESTLASLVAAQNDDGSMGWIRKGNRDTAVTCAALRFFALAQSRGLVAARDAARKASESLLRALRRARPDERPNMLWALATVDSARFESLNTAHRARGSLKLGDMARLALAWQAEKRPELAAEVFAGMRGKIVLSEKPNAEQIEAVALAARALLAQENRDGDGRKALEWVQAQRRGATWGTPTATAASVGASLQGTVFPAGGEPAGSAITVVVNGKEIGTVARGAERKNSVFTVPTALLKAQGNDVRVQVKGDAKVNYTATLSGFAEGFRDADRNRSVLRVERKYLADGLRHDNKAVPAGFGVVQAPRSRRFENEITRLEVGAKGRVRLNFWPSTSAMGRAISPIVVEEPIPAGCTVARDSISGNFDHVEVEPHRLIFFYRADRTSDTVSYELQARFPGKFRALPTRAYGALRPDLLSHGRPRALAVYGRGKGEPDAYRLTPDELYHLGKAKFDAGDLQGAGKHLDQLLSEWHQGEVVLRDNIFREVARMMLFVAIERGESAAVVRFFEDLKDRYQDLVIPFDKILAVGRAYLDIGEFEASLMVFRATADASFLKDAAVVTTLEQKGEVKASVDFLRQLLLDYPDLNTMRMSLYGIGQRLAALAAERKPGQPVDSRIGTTEELRGSAVAAFREFLVFYPEDPLAEEVSFAWATTLLEGEKLDRALQVADAALARYPASAFEDELLYTKGYVLFAEGQHEAAFQALEKVASGEFTRPDGSRGESENKNHAIYLQGQIHHARGEPAKALAAYEKVEDLFSDAGEAAFYFERKDLSLPEVTTLKMDEEAKVDLGFRNVAKAHVQVFRVDLMRLYLLEKSLNDIRGIQLHGIQAFREFDLELGNGRDYRAKKKTLEIDLPESGAYLVVVRGDDRLATGMVLRTDLVIEAQEDTGSGRMRVNVKRNGAFLGDAHVKVVGSQDGRFRSGDTDLRGVFVADGLIGKATVIVKREDEYAFFRGSEIHQPRRYRPVPMPKKADAQTAVPQTKGKAFGAFDNNYQLNGGNRARQVQWLNDEVLNRKQKGVEVYRTK